MLFFSFREEPIPEDKRESCANTELGPEVFTKYQILFSIFDLCHLGEEQLHDILGLHIQHGQLRSQRNYKVGVKESTKFSISFDMTRFLVQHRMVDCLVTSAGGIEEDFIKYKCFTFLGRTKLFFSCPFNLDA